MRLKGIMRMYTRHMFPIIKYRSFLPHFALHKLHFDHRVFPWGKQRMTILKPGTLLHPQNLDSLLSTEHSGIIMMNQRELLPEAIKQKVSPVFETPFLFDIYDPHCYVFTDEEYYKHLLTLIKKKS